MRTKLFLIPGPIHEEAEPVGFPEVIAAAVSSVRVFFTEHERSARRALKKTFPEFPLEQCQFLPLNEHTPPKAIEQYLKIALEQNSGIISEAGCPAVADPGAELVFWAHRKGVEVVPLVGPSSILLSLMASGLNGQNFAFVGYLPKERQARLKKIKMLEERSRAEQQTQIFMETPYRNQKLFAELVETCHPQTLLCVAADLTGKEEFVRTQAISEWKGMTPSIHKKPALFLILRRDFFA